MGVMAAFIFAAQMINFPVLGGTSGHMLGAVLAAVLLGPWAATLVMSSVIAVQALLFQDGGLLAMGANIVNMGLIGTIGGYAIYRTVARLLGGEPRGRLPAAAIAAWSSRASPAERPTATPLSRPSVPTSILRSASPSARASTASAQNTGISGSSSRWRKPR